MQRVITRSSLIPPLWAWLLQVWRRIEGQPALASGLLIAAWCLSRGVLFIGLLISHSYCDPQFYDYAGKFAYGQWPYTSAFPVEYPPLAMVLILRRYPCCRLPRWHHVQTLPLARSLPICPHRIPYATARMV
jgi:hypothetical protein